MIKYIKQHKHNTITNNERKRPFFGVTDVTWPKIESKKSSDHNINHDIICRIESSKLILLESKIELIFQEKLVLNFPMDPFLVF